MKLSLSVIAVTTIVASATASPVRSAIKRKLEQSSEYEDALAMFGVDMDDFACLMSAADSELECLDAGDCVFCPVGDLAGFCVSSAQAGMVNMVGVPHITCGAPSSQEDTKFWNDLVGCEMMGGSSESCTSSPTCSWCSMHGGQEAAVLLEEQVFETMPSFGFCLSKDFMAETVQLISQDEEGADVIELMKVIVSCNDDADANAPGLFDVSCAMMSFDQSFCSSSRDAMNEQCVFTDVLGMAEVCMSSAQSNMLDWYLKALEEEGIDIQAIMNGDMSSLMDGDMADMMGGDVMGGDMMGGDMMELGSQNVDWDVVPALKAMPFDGEAVEMVQYSEEIAEIKEEGEN